MASPTLTLFVIAPLIPGTLAAQTTGRAQSALPKTFEARDTYATIEGAAGTTLDGGYIASASAGVSPTPWLTLLAEGEAFHRPTRNRTFVTRDGFYVESSQRGFTTYLFGGEVRIGAPVARRVTPYGAVGMNAGTWQSNVDHRFSRRDSGPIVSAHAGGGVRVALRPQLSVIAGARMTLAVAGEDVLGYVPIKGGLAWGF